MTVGILAALQTKDILQGGKGYLAWCVLLALGLSSIVHGVMRLWKGPEAIHRKDEEARGEKIILLQQEVSLELASDLVSGTEGTTRISTQT
ncbi:hypothetical protein BDZ45DRAFT_667504 [Acephala macrosclerotiorum]|nr:hypothetical protein BDZ45DRAFT_667504 [Acephala macrosclerotiorum]